MYKAQESYLYNQYFKEKTGIDIEDLIFQGLLGK